MVKYVLKITFFYRKCLADNFKINYKLLVIITSFCGLTPALQHFNITRIIHKYRSTENKSEKKNALKEFWKAQDLVSKQCLWEVYLETIPQITFQIHVTFNLHKVPFSIVCKLYLIDIFRDKFYLSLFSPC